MISFSEAFLLMRTSNNLLSQGIDNLIIASGSHQSTGSIRCPVSKEKKKQKPPITLLKSYDSIDQISMSFN